MITVGALPNDIVTYIFGFKGRTEEDALMEWRHQVANGMHLFPSDFYRDVPSGVRFNWDEDRQLRALPRLSSSTLYGMKLSTMAAPSAMSNLRQMAAMIWYTKTSPTHDPRKMPIERLSLLRNWSRLFESATHVAAWDSKAARKMNVDAYLQSSVVTVRAHAYGVVERALSLRKRAHNISGVLVFHADFWLNPFWLAASTRHTARHRLADAPDLERGWLPLSTGQFITNAYADVPSAHVVNLYTGLLNLSLPHGCRMVRMHNSTYIHHKTHEPLSSRVATVHGNEAVTSHADDAIIVREALRSLCARQSARGSSSTGHFHHTRTCKHVRAGGASTWPFCFGWADAFYLPSRWLAPFYEAARHFKEHHLVHELAMPLIMRLLAEALTPDGLHRYVHCAGCCCCRLPADLATLRSIACGHTIDLQRASVRDTLLSTIGDVERLQVRTAASSKLDG